jgi:segregation and condensation protein B
MDELTPSESAGSVSGAIEALLLMATEPLSSEELAQAVAVPVPQVEAELGDLQRFYDESGRGFELRRVGNGWRYYTREEHAELIARWLLEGQQGKLSQAALETLAVVAYLQPISRGRVSAVRGVNVDGVMRTLATRELIEEVGADAETGAHLFGTTPLFLEKMGLTSLDELPPIAPYLPDASLLEAELSELAVFGQSKDAGGPDNGDAAGVHSSDAPADTEAAGEVVESGADG